MKVATKLASFGVALVATFAIAFGVGQAVGPVGEDSPTPASTTTTVDPNHGGHS